MSTSFAVLFDMDGVIAHTNPTHKQVIKEFCFKHGKEVSDAFLQQKVYGRTNAEWIPEVFGPIPYEEMQAYADEKEALFREAYAPLLKAVEGLPDFLERLGTAGIPMVVATSAPGKNADFILDGLHIKQKFEKVLDSSHVSKGKPEPEVYLKASATINMQPERCIVMEDSLAGVEAGKRAGCRVIGITTTHTKEELSGCDLVIDNFIGLEVKDLEALLA